MIQKYKKKKKTQVENDSKHVLHTRPILQIKKNAQMGNDGCRRAHSLSVC